MAKRGLVIGGVSRSGKTRLARRVAAQTGMSRIPADALVTAMERFFPQNGIVHSGISHAEICKNSTPFFMEYWAQSLWDEDLTFVFDTFHLLPSELRKYEQDKRLAFMFMGYPDITGQEMLARIKANTADDEWMHEMGEAEQLVLFESFIATSRRMKEECHEAGIPFIDTSKDFHATSDEAYKLALDLIGSNA